MKKNVDKQINRFLKTKFKKYPECEELGLEILREAQKQS